jgi:hypothetical protein
LVFGQINLNLELRFFSRDQPASFIGKEESLGHNGQPFSSYSGYGRSNLLFLELISMTALSKPKSLIKKG